MQQLDKCHPEVVANTQFNAWRRVVGPVIGPAFERLIDALKTKPMIWIQPSNPVITVQPAPVDPRVDRLNADAVKTEHRLDSVETKVATLHSERAQEVHALRTLLTVAVVALAVEGGIYLTQDHRPVVNVTTAQQAQGTTTLIPGANSFSTLQGWEQTVPFSTLCPANIIQATQITGTQLHPHDKNGKPDGDVSYTNPNRESALMMVSVFSNSVQGHTLISPNGVGQVAIKINGKFYPAITAYVHARQEGFFYCTMQPQ